MEDRREKRRREGKEGKCLIPALTLLLPYLLGTSRAQGSLHFRWPHTAEPSTPPMIPSEAYGCLEGQGRDWVEESGNKTVREGQLGTEPEWAL